MKDKYPIDYKRLMLMVNAAQLSGASLTKIIGIINSYIKTDTHEDRKAFLIEFVGKLETRIK